MPNVRGLLGFLLLCAVGMRPAHAATAPAWSLNQPIYEVNLQMFSQAGTYRALQEHLPELKSQGIGILWLMPVTTRGVLKAFGSPYCVRDFLGLHAPFGSAQDLRNLVSATHAQGLHLILDWVPNHSSWDNALISQHPEFYKQDAGGHILQAYSWGDVAQFDYSKPAMRAWMIEAMKSWVRDYDVDGFRCDVAWGVPADFWAQARAELDKVKPVFMLAEANNVVDQGGFDSNYDWDLLNVSEQTVLTDIAAGRKPADYLDGLLAKEKAKGYLPGFRRMRFTSNHDEWNNFGTPFQRLGAGVKTFAVLTATLPGKPLLYNGQEIGWNPRDRGNPITWADSGGYRDFYRRLLRLHQDNAAMNAGDYTKLKSGRDAAIFAFLRSQGGPGGKRVAVILNLSGTAADYTLNQAALAGSYRDLFTGQLQEKSAEWRGSLEAWGYQVLVGESASSAVTTPLPGAARVPSAPKRVQADGKAQPIGSKRSAGAFFLSP
jgi:cyclomaltodextrinase / maltogenic alpha-amylase / neopullulanase